MNVFSQDLNTFFATRDLQTVRSALAQTMSGDIFFRQWAVDIMLQSKFVYKAKYWSALIGRSPMYEKIYRESVTRLARNFN